MTKEKTNPAKGWKELCAWALATLCCCIAAIAVGTGMLYASEPWITHVGPFPSHWFGFGCIASAVPFFLAALRITHPYRR